MKRTLLLCLALTGALTACGSSGPATTVSSDRGATGTLEPSASASPTDAPITAVTLGPGATGTCTPAGTGTTDLKTKPVYQVTKADPPTTTTVTDVVCGTGPEAKEGSDVEVRYVGVNYADGKEFDSSWSRGDTLPFTIGSGVIAGFSKGVTGMRVGGRRQVVIPPQDGYGDGGPVPGGTLVFLIDLVKVG